MVRFEDLLLDTDTRRKKGIRARRVKSDAKASRAFSDLVDETLQEFGKPVAVIGGAVFSIKKIGRNQYVITRHLGYVAHSGSFVINEKGIPYIIPYKDEERLLTLRWRGSKNIKFSRLGTPLKEMPKVRVWKPIELVG